MRGAVGDERGAHGNGPLIVYLEYGPLLRGGGEGSQERNRTTHEAG